MFALRLQSLESPKATILREARNKFRVHSLSHVFLQGGTSLEQDEDIPDRTTRVWIGKGEPYNGPPSVDTRTTDLPEVRVIAENSYIDEKAVKQLERVAALPGVRLVVGMPDLHPGNRFPVGVAVAALCLYPALVGSDIGCGIALYHLSNPSRTNPDPTKLASLLRGLDDPWSGSTEEWLSHYGVFGLSPFDRDSLGTIGGGNHFAEICKVERIVCEETAERLGIKAGGLYLLGMFSSPSFHASCVLMLLISAHWIPGSR
jgi:release factor H-coupled RctB family protein